jgi:hypothetical protein
MMNNTKQFGFSLVFAAGLSAAASAGVVNGNLFTMDQRGEVVAEFLNSNAGATGSLYFLGHSAVGDSITYAASSDANGLGQFLFSNKGTSKGTSVGLGTFDLGDSLYFAYIINKGSGGAKTGTLARNDLAPDVDFFQTLSFALTPEGSRSVIGVEDIFKRTGSDWDYNDMTFSLGVSSIPTPGAGLLAVMGGAVACRRKRREIAAT